ncbi:MAG: DUF3445 domain-containing protein [Acidimicrobiales bacterium]|jgi:hypothetical protein|nr:DUF3445 domain-containing protein [Acidimicrobiales bacterium]
MATATPDWLEELPLRAGPPWLSMGVHPLELDRWLVVDDRRDADLALKAALSRDHHVEVVAALAGTEAAGAETLGLVRDWLTRHHPELGADPAGVLADARRDRHPLETAGLLVQEDLCLLGPPAPDGTGGDVLTAAAVWFPSHWRIADKIGRPLAAVHAPVGHYAEELERKVDTFVTRLRPERPVWRRNLSIHSHDDLFRPEPHEAPESYEGRGIEGVWLRSEYQTLRRLPTTGAVLFTIRTQVCPAAALTAVPHVASALAAALRAKQSDLRRLGEAPPFPGWLPDWLAATGQVRGVTPWGRP